MCNHTWQPLISFTVPFNGKFRRYFCLDCHDEEDLPKIEPGNLTQFHTDDFNGQMFDLMTFDSIPLDKLADAFNQLP